MESIFLGFCLFFFIFFVIATSFGVVLAFIFVFKEVRRDDAKKTVAQTDAKHYEQRNEKPNG